MGLPEWYRNACAATSVLADRRIFFVLGCQKSGTTWVAGLVDAHPEVCCRGEGHVSDLIGPMVEQVGRLYNEDGRTAYTIAPEAVFSAVRLLADHVLGQYLAECSD
ncbi:MAG: sulfotransferase, partial [Planctomycetota bacterium]